MPGIIDWVMRRTSRNEENGIRWKFNTKLDNLGYADNNALISTTKTQTQEKTNRLVENGEHTGLKEKGVKSAYISESSGLSGCSLSQSTSTPPR